MNWMNKTHELDRSIGPETTLILNVSAIISSSCGHFKCRHSRSLTSTLGEGRDGREGRTKDTVGIVAWRWFMEREEKKPKVALRFDKTYHRWYFRKGMFTTLNLIQENRGSLL